MVGEYGLVVKAVPRHIIRWFEFDSRAGKFKMLVGSHYHIVYDSQLGL